MAISDNLIKDEKIVFESKKHWAAPLRDSIVPALMIVGFLLLRTISPNGGGLFGAVGSLMDFIALGLLVVGNAHAQQFTPRTGGGQGGGGKQAHGAIARTSASG